MTIEALISLGTLGAVCLAAAVWAELETRRLRRRRRALLGRTAYRAFPKSS